MKSINLTSRQNGIGHSAPITHVTFSKDGARLATCSYDGTVIVWDSSIPSQLREITCLKHRRLVNGAAWNPDDQRILATASADKTVGVWKLNQDGTSNVVSVLAHHSDDVNSVSWLPDGRRLVCVSEDGKATMWDAINGRFMGPLVAHSGHCMMVSVSCNGLISTVGEDGLVAIISSDQTGEVSRRTYAGSIEGCAWSHEGTRLTIARDDGYLDILSVELKTISSIKVSTSAVRSVAWTANDSMLIVGAYDGIVRLFTLESKCMGQFKASRVWPRSVTTAKGKAAIGSYGSTPYVIDDVQMQELHAPVVPTNGPNVLAARNGNLLVGCDSGLIVEVDTKSVISRSGIKFTTLSPSSDPILSLAATQDDIYAGSYFGNVLRINSEGTESCNVGAPIPSILVGNGKILCGTYGGEVISLDAPTLNIRCRKRIHEGSIKSMAWLEDDVFVSAATDRLVSVGNLESRKSIWEHGNLVNAVSCLDQGIIVSGSRDHSVKIGYIAKDENGAWEVTLGLTLLGADESVKAVGVLGTHKSPVVLAGSYDFGLYCWHVDCDSAVDLLRLGDLVKVFNQAVSHICRIDRYLAAVASWDGSIAFVNVQGGKVSVLEEFNLNDILCDPIS